MKTLKLSTCLYEITEFYIEKGYHPEEAEDCAWKNLQGGGILIPTKTVDEKMPELQATNRVNFDVPIPF